MTEMSDLWKKLNRRAGQRVLIIDAPDSFEIELARLPKEDVARDPSKESEISFLVAFVTRRSEIKRIAKILPRRALGDPVIWFAYPKMTSKRYQCDFNRDTGWEPVNEAGFRGVRQVAIDSDWSALRFRREAFIRRK